MAPVQRSHDRIMGAGRTFVDATLNAQFSAIADYQQQRAADGKPWG
jgi:hypothetical protein